MSNLPHQTTSFIGREQEMAELKRRLSTTHLLTLTGVGGTGKTRLSLQLAADLLQTYPDGVWWVELAPLADPALVPTEVAAVLGVREEPGRACMATLTDELRPKHLLLILDNCEHLLAACGELAEALLPDCPQLQILVTSREALGVPSEKTFPVPSLALPEVGLLPPIDSLAQYESIRLFSDRARVMQPDFTVTDTTAPAVAQICRRLDGLPLAIELAAATMQSLDVDQMAAKLDDRFRMLTGGSRTALPRQQTLKTLCDWCFSLLSEPERDLLCRLSVFAGGWTLAAAAAVCMDTNVEQSAAKLSNDIPDLLAHLVDQSLVIAVEQWGETRYHMLETLRQYAQDKLWASGEGEGVRDRHLAYFRQWSAVLEPQLSGPDPLQVERHNLRAALQWGQEEDDMVWG